MALIKWNGKQMYDPWDDVRSLQEQINDLFDFGRFPSARGLFDRSDSPAIDVIDTENDFTVLCELPGLSLDDVDLSFASNVLTLKGRKKEQENKDGGSFYKKETWSGNFQRTLSLPVPIDGEKISAEFKDGVLKVVLPKREESKPKQITVKIK